MKKLTLALLTVAAAVTVAARDTQVDEKRPASADALVEIEDITGTLRIVGWDREEVAVKGTLDPHIEDFTFEGGRRVRLQADSDVPHAGSSDLDIHVPVGATVEIDTFAAEIDIRGVKGSVRAETVNGSIHVDGSEADVDLETVNGGLTILGPARRVRAESVNGTVSIKGARDEVDASTVNGELNVDGGTFRRARLETVNGEILFDGGLSASATLDVESVSGAVTLTLPEGVGADFSVSSFSGNIEHEFPGPQAKRTSRWTSEKELQLTTGGGGAKVSIHTLSGDVELRKKK